MPDGDGLASAVAHIDRRMDQIGHAIEAARKQVEQAARALEEVKRNQAQQQAALNTLSAQLDAAIRESREGIADLRKRVDDVSASIAALAERSRSMQDMLQTIIAQHLEKKLRRERESEWASFILRLHGLLRRIGDPAVRVVFAFDALEAIERRKLRSTSFLSAADQAAMDERLYKIERAGTDLSEPHRTEADAFMRLRALDRDAVGLRSRWQEQIRKLLEDTNSAENHVTEARRLLLDPRRSLAA